MRGGIIILSIIAAWLVLPLSPVHAEYQDGMNKYEFEKSSPVNHLDPTGTTVIITKEARGSVESLLPQLSITNVRRDEFADMDVYSGNQAHFANDGGVSEIVGSMIKSKRVFRVQGERKEEAIQNWQLHVTARLRTIQAARSKTFHFAVGEAKYNPAVWREEENVYGKRLRPIGNNKYSALADLWDVRNGDDYALGCTAGTGAVLLRGISRAIGQDAYNKNAKAPLNPFSLGSVMPWLNQDDPVGWDDWVPGDWGYIINTKWDPKDPHQAGQEGENIVYLGQGKFWGHINASVMIRTKEEWMDIVRVWGEAEPASWRRYPRVGLQ